MSSDTGRLRLTSAILRKLESVEWTRSLLLISLLSLSWWSTTQGLIGLVTAANGAPGPTAILTIGFAIGILTLLISWTLDRLHSGEAGLLAPLFLGGYLLLTVISVGFGYGFYWKHIESHSAAQRSAEREAERLSQQFTMAYGRLDESISALNAVAMLSVDRAEREADQGGTCGTASQAGPGPRYRLRREDAASMTALRKRITSQIGEPVAPADGTLLALRGELDRQLSHLSTDVFAALDEAQIKKLLQETEQVMAETASRYETFRTGPSVTHAVTLLEDRILRGQGVMQDSGIEFTCPDTELDIIMTQAADALSTLPEIPRIELNVPLGPEATVAAFGKFGNTMLAPLRRDSDAELMAGRDYIPLGVAIAIDLFILILSLHGKPARPLTGHARTDAMFERPDFVHHLIGKTPDMDDPAHLELLKYSFWWRGAYYLALPAHGRIDDARHAAHQRLSMAAMVLADAGLLIPLASTYREGQWREKLSDLHSRHAAAPAASDYHLYRYKQNSLTRMTALLAHGTTAGVTNEATESLTPLRAPLQKTAPAPRPADKQRVAGLISAGGAWVKRRGLPRRKK